MKGILLTSQIVENGGQDLFNDAWTTGDLNKIGWLTGPLGEFAMQVISVVGLCIVIFSILKNAISGLYVMAPHIWDKVDQVKKDSATKYAKGGDKATQKIGSLFATLLDLLPNVRDLTEFATKDGQENVSGEDIDKKQYFIKAIPALVAQIFIGMLIFYGTPSKLANWVGTGATYGIEVILSNADPVTFIQGVSTKFVDIKLATDNSNLKTDQLVNDAVREAIPILSTKYSDVLQESLQTAAYNIEGTLITRFSSDSVKNAIESPGYTTRVTASFYPNLPKISSDFKPVDNSMDLFSSTASNGVITFRYWQSVASMSTGSTLVGTGDHIVWTVTCTPKAVTEANTSAIVLYGGEAFNFTPSGDWSLTALSDFKYEGSPTEGQGAITGSLGTCTVTFYAGGSVSFTAQGRLERAGGTASTSSKLVLYLPKNAIPAKVNGAYPFEYIDIEPSSEMSYTILQDNMNHTYVIEKLRVTTNSNTAESGALTSWPAYNDVDTSGVAINKIVGAADKPLQ